MNCPYCNKSDCVPYIVFANVERYGSNGFNVPCEKCGKIIYVYAEKTVEIIDIRKSDKKESDFPANLR